MTHVQYRRLKSPGRIGILRIIHDHIGPQVRVLSCRGVKPVWDLPRLVVDSEHPELEQLAGGIRDRRFATSNRLLRVRAADHGTTLSWRMHRVFQTIAFLDANIVQE